MALITQSASVTRPANTSSYTTGMMVGSSQTAASCTSMVMQFPFPSMKVWTVGLVRTTSTTSQYKVHLFNSAPVLVSGDNTSLSLTSTSGYLGSWLVDMSTSIGNPNVGYSTSGAPIAVNLSYSSGNNLYALLTVNTSAAGVSAEKFTVSVCAEPLSFQQ